MTSTKSDLSSASRFAVSLPSASPRFAPGFRAEEVLSEVVLAEDGLREDPDFAEALPMPRQRQANQTVPRGSDGGHALREVTEKRCDKREDGTKSMTRTNHVARMQSCIPTTSVIARLDRAIQYAAASRLKHRRLWITGSPGPVYAKASTRPRIPGTPKL